MELVLENVGKQYNGKFWGLRNFNLELQAGILGLLGPNGAGKSTLMRILATVTQPTEGTITWNGKNIVTSPNAIREILGYLPQDFGVYPNLNAVEFLGYMASIKGLEASAAKKRIDELLHVVNLTEARKRPLGSYSGGMKQRIGIAQALLNDPKLLIVDEPTVGLDPEERVRFRNLLSDLSGERIVILSTHIVSDVESTATQIATIAEGRLIAHSTSEVLLKEVEGKVWTWVVSSEDMQEVRRNHLISSTIRQSDGVHVRIVAENTPDSSAQSSSPTLEDAYLYCVERSRNSHRIENGMGV